MARGGNPKEEALRALVQNARTVQKQIGSLMARAQKQTEALGLVIAAAERALASGRSVAKRASDVVASRTAKPAAKRRTTSGGAKKRTTKPRTRSTAGTKARTRRSSGGSSRG